MVEKEKRKKEKISPHKTFPNGKNMHNKRKGSVGFMLKKMAWNVFKKTGSVDVFLEIRALEELEQNKANNQYTEEIAEEISKMDSKERKKWD